MKRWLSMLTALMMLTTVALHAGVKVDFRVGGGAAAQVGVITATLTVKTDGSVVLKSIATTAADVGGPEVTGTVTGAPIADYDITLQFEGSQNIRQTGNGELGIGNNWFGTGNSMQCRFNIDNAAVGTTLDVSHVTINGRAADGQVRVSSVGSGAQLFPFNIGLHNDIDISGLNTTVIQGDGLTAAVTLEQNTQEFNFQSLTFDITAPPPAAVYDITATDGRMGDINPRGVVQVAEGFNKTFKFFPEPGYTVNDVVVDGVSLGRARTRRITEYTFSNVTSNHTIYVTFAPTHTLTSSAGPNGTINPLGSFQEKEGNYQAFEMLPNEGYEVEDVLIDGVSHGPIAFYEFQNISAPHTIHVTFRKSHFTISATAGADGAIDPEGDVLVKNGDEQTFNITPDDGYEITNVLVDGNARGPIETYTFSDVAADHSISATFNPIGQAKHTISASSDAGGSITPDGSIILNAGGDQGFTISPDPGHEIADVLVDGASVGAVETYNFTGVTADHTIHAAFRSIEKSKVTVLFGIGSGANAQVGQVTVVIDIDADGNATLNSVTGSGARPAPLLEVTGSVTTKPDAPYQVVLKVDATKNVRQGGLGDLGSGNNWVSPGEWMNCYFDVSSAPAGSQLFIPELVLRTIREAGATAAITTTGSPAQNFTFPLGNDNLIDLSGMNTGVSREDGETMALGMVNVAEDFALRSVSFDVVSGHAVTAYTITATAGVNGSITPNGSIRVQPARAAAAPDAANGGAVTVAANAEYTFMIFPNEGYVIDDVFVDNVSQGPISIYTFTNVEDDHVIHATFRPAVTTAVDGASAPEEFALNANYPNPFNPTTTISYQMPISGNVRLDVYDLMGHVVATLFNGRQAAGSYQMEFNASHLASGVYFCRIEVRGSGHAFRQLRKMVLSK